jgi:hypothetical protein
MLKHAIYFEERRNEFILAALDKNDIDALAASSIASQKENMYAKSILRAFDDLFSSANITTEMYEEAQIYYSIEQDPEYVKVCQDNYIKIRSLTRSMSGVTRGSSKASLNFSEF